MTMLQRCNFFRKEVNYLMSKLEVNPDNVAAFYDIATKAMSAIKADKKLWSKMTMGIFIFCAVMCIATVCSLAYFIFGGSFYPLASCMAIAVVAIYSGMMETLKNMKKIQKEYTEYDTAVKDMMKALTYVEPGEERDMANTLVRIMGAAITAATVNTENEVVDFDNIILSDMVYTPEFPKAYTLATRLLHVYALADKVSEEGGDIDVMLSELSLAQFSETHAQEMEELATTLEKYTGVNKPSEEEKTDPEPEEEKTDPEPEDKPKNWVEITGIHIIPVDDGPEEEDTSLIV